MIPKNKRKFEDIKSEVHNGSELMITAKGVKVGGRFCLGTYTKSHGWKPNFIIKFVLTEKQAQKVVDLIHEFDQERFNF